MTDKRKAEIKQRAEERAKRMAAGYATYWLTRDLWQGVLADKVEVWLVRPERHTNAEGDVVWTRPPGSEPSVLHGRWTLAHAQVEAGAGVPQDARQCLRVGPEPKAAPIAGTPAAP